MRSCNLAIGVGLLFMMAAGAQATPEMAAKEGKPCAYCHINPAGDLPLNYRGRYYSAHGLTFTGFTEEPLPSPGFQLLWQQVLTGSPTRVAVGDTRGDKKRRLVLVTSGNDPGSRTISIQSWDRPMRKLVEEASIPGGTDTDRMELGAYGSSRAAAMVLPTGYIQFNGQEYAFHKDTGAENLSGAARQRDAIEAFYLLNGENTTARQMKPGPEDEGWMSSAPNLAAPLTGAYWWGEARGAAAPLFAQKVGIPGDTRSLSLVGVWDPLGTGVWYYYLPEHIENGEMKGDYVALYPAKAPAGSAAQPTWRSPKLAGKVLDITEGRDIRGGRLGLYVLTDGSEAQDGKTLYFFALD